MSVTQLHKQLPYELPEMPHIKVVACSWWSAADTVGAVLTHDEITGTYCCYLGVAGEEEGEYESALNIARWGSKPGITVAKAMFTWADWDKIGPRWKN